MVRDVKVSLLHVVEVPSANVKAVGLYFDFLPFPLIVELGVASGPALVLSTAWIAVAAPD
jgi:hypothetical protein